MYSVHRYPGTGISWWEVTCSMKIALLLLVLVVLLQEGRGKRRRKPASSVRSLVPPQRSMVSQDKNTGNTRLKKNPAKKILTLSMKGRVPLNVKSKGKKLAVKSRHLPVPVVNTPSPPTAKLEHPTVARQKRSVNEAAVKEDDRVEQESYIAGYEDGRRDGELQESTTPQRPTQGQVSPGVHPAPETYPGLLSVWSSLLCGPIHPAPETYPGLLSVWRSLLCGPSNPTFLERPFAGTSQSSQGYSPIPLFTPEI